MTRPGAKSEFLTEGALPQSLRGALVVPRLGTQVSGCAAFNYTGLDIMIKYLEQFFELTWSDL